LPQGATRCGPFLMKDNSQIIALYGLILSIRVQLQLHLSRHPTPTAAAPPPREKCLKTARAERDACMADVPHEAHAHKNVFVNLLAV